jgi:hypothetical protein
MVPCGGSTSDPHHDQGASAPGGTYIAMVGRKKDGGFSHYTVSFVGPDNRADKAKRLGSAKALEAAKEIAQQHADKAASEAAE